VTSRVQARLSTLKAEMVENERAKQQKQEEVDGFKKSVEETVEKPGEKEAEKFLDDLAEELAARQV
jgi:hypothetical protein